MTSWLAASDLKCFLTRQQTVFIPPKEQHSQQSFDPGGGFQLCYTQNSFVPRGGDGVCYCDVEAAWRCQRGVFPPSHVRCFSDTERHVSFFLLQWKREARLDFSPRGKNLVATPASPVGDWRSLFGSPVKTDAAHLAEVKSGQRCCLNTITSTLLKKKKKKLLDFWCLLKTSDTLNTCLVWHWCNRLNYGVKLRNTMSPFRSSVQPQLIICVMLLLFFCFNSVCAETMCRWMTFVGARQTDGSCFVRLPTGLFWPIKQLCIKNSRMFTNNKQMVEGFFFCFCF